MTDERDEIMMSQLADGELTSDQANELLLTVLDEPAGRERLKDMLLLRQATASWRSQQPQRPVVILSSQPGSLAGGPTCPTQPAPPSRSGFGHRLGGLAVAACLGGLLVLAGMWSAGHLIGPTGPATPGEAARAAVSVLPAERVSPEQMRQVAKVFALHESVAGPLAWYAADDQIIRLASARGAEASQTPIAVLLKLAPAADGASARTLVIVCRENEPTVIELPAESAGQAGLRVYLDPRAVNGKVQMQYAIAIDGQAGESTLASIRGQRNVGLSETQLGQLAMGEKLLNVEAAAWPMRGEGKP